MRNLKTALNEGVVKLQFLKADGTVREMDATLKEYLLPETTQKSNHPEGETTVVYDLDAEGWRSFRNDRLVSWETYD